MLREKIENGQYKVFFQTLGCKVNRYETDAIRQAFLTRGFHIVTDSEEADIIVINTCTVTAEADRKSRQMIRRAKNKQPGVIVVAMGCQVQMQKSASEADIAVGTTDRLQLLEQLTHWLQQNSIGVKPAERKALEGEHAEFSEANFLANLGHSENSPSDLDGEAVIPTSPLVYPELGTATIQEETRAYIKIEDGCNSFCSYCIIPFARGRVVSRPLDAIIHEAELLAAQGFKEIVLTGIHLCSYGQDWGEDIMALGKLIQHLAEIPTLKRIRLGSLEPNSLTEAFIELLSKIPQLCPQFHLSLQSGSDSVLKRMNRKYTRERYLSVVEQLRRYFPHCAITTDIIAGFPQESLAEHLETMDFCKTVGFSRLHVFPYSDREGTQAYEMTPKVPKAERERRSREIMALGNELASAYAASFLHKQVSVLLEKEEVEGVYSGYTEEYVRITLRQVKGYSSGDIVLCEADEVEGQELCGNLATIA